MNADTIKEYVEAVMPLINTLLAWASGWVVIYLLYRAAPRIWAWLTSLPPVVVDGTLYTSWTMLTFVLAFFSEESVYKYFNIYFIIYARLFFGTLVAGAGALKTFRSTSFADHQKETKASTS